MKSRAQSPRLPAQLRAPAQAVLADQAGHATNAVEVPRIFWMPPAAPRSKRSLLLRQRAARRRLRSVMPSITPSAARNEQIAPPPFRLPVIDQVARRDIVA